MVCFDSDTFSAFRRKKKKRKETLIKRKCLEILFAIKNYFFLEYWSCFTMLYQFLLYSKVNQLYIYIYPLFFGFPFHLGHYRTLSSVLWVEFPVLWDFSGGAGKESTCQCRRHKKLRFDPWVWKIIWSRKWQLTPVFLPGKFHEQRSLVGCIPWGQKELYMTACEHTPCAIQWVLISYSFIFKNWSVIVSQCCVRFCRTPVWISCVSTYIPSLLNFPPTTSPPIPPF